MNLDLVDDFDVFDNQEEVEYIRKSIDGDEDSVEGVPALRRPIIQEEWAGAVQHLGPQAVWHIRLNAIEFTPARGDRILTESNGTWEVMETRTETLMARYKVRCVKK
jgi:hypothetical protein